MHNQIIDRLKNIEKMLRMLLAKEAVDADQNSIKDPSPQSTLAAPVPPPWKNNEYMKPDEIAKEIGVDVSTVRRWLREGQIPSVRFGRAVRVKTKDFEKYLKDNHIS